MAKRKKQPAKHTRRRRVGGANSDVYVTIGGALLGFVGGKMLAAKVLPTVDDKIKGVGLAAIGVFGVPMVSKGALAKGVTIGMGIAGGELLLQSTGLISGSRMIAYPKTYQIAGNGIADTVGGQGISATVGNMRRAYKEA